MKLIMKDDRSISSDHLLIVEQPKYRALDRIKSGRPLKVEWTGEMQYLVYELEVPKVFDDKASFVDFFQDLDECRKKYPDVELLKWEKLIEAQKTIK